MKLFFIVATSFIFFSCSPQINTEKIKLPVFGGLMLGIKSSVSKKLIDSLIRADELKLTENNYPFFVFDKRDEISLTKILLFPNIYREDSTITKIVYHIYRLNFITQEIYDNITDEAGKERITRRAERTQSLFTSLKSEFKFRDDYDWTFGYHLPLVGAGYSPEISNLRNDILPLLEKKYGQPKKDTVGNRYDNKDLTFYESAIWKTDIANISLVSRRLPGTGIESEIFYTVLIYEYNDKTRKEYKLEAKKSKDLKNTF